MFNPAGYTKGYATPGSPGGETNGLYASMTTNNTYKEDPTDPNSGSGDTGSDGSYDPTPIDLSPANSDPTYDMGPAGTTYDPGTGLYYDENGNGYDATGTLVSTPSPGPDTSGGSGGGGGSSTGSSRSGGGGTPSSGTPATRASPGTSSGTPINIPSIKNPFKPSGTNSTTTGGSVLSSFGNLSTMTKIAIGAAVVFVVWKFAHH